MLEVMMCTYNFNYAGGISRSITIQGWPWANLETLFKTNN
jgi:hypothetical protein